MEPGAVLIGLVVAIIALLIFTVIFQWIWNAVIPDVFGSGTLPSRRSEFSFWPRCPADIAS